MKMGREVRYVLFILRIKIGTINSAHHLQKLLIFHKVGGKYLKKKKISNLRIHGRLVRFLRQPQWALEQQL